MGRGVAIIQAGMVVKQGGREGWRNQGMLLAWCSRGE